MDKLQKTIIYWSLAALVIILTVFFMVSINQKLNTSTTTNVVSFSGQGKAFAKPDIATLDFSIITEASTSKAAQDSNSKKSQQITEFLKKQDIAEKDIKTTYYNIYPKYSSIQVPIMYDERQIQAYPPYPVPTEPKIVGYSVNQGFQVKVRDFDKLSSIVDGLVLNGVNNVNNLGFSIEDPEKLRSEARTLAIADAKKKADELKGKIGIKLGKIVNFYEDIYGYALDRGGGYGGVESAPVKGPSLPPGENEITVNVTLTYQIK
ncbi:MAG: hypothetical protein A2831_03045 [Candidatus Yanofskybacteria bacterium RIFCSPHIGHO2_01_FULL_44_17]|uniref:26 kDa periplasmic immunogenic protein n=1 Tax=Candidatus Yanofskybacteria bacterium RIFCSPHIGHO2_01_FULL_44_17 TaxID=1802668 RepID=A0A1F8EY86_9BACT|nr:MAG: hypothetical protein A2831_03045 [Candidatus Yanofskybacteria bacterium RIFCSPHIGHO2_01_FULL_44_17]